MKQPPFTPGDVFHIYNRANGRENLFVEHENYLFFQRKFIEKVGNLVDTLAFCLMPNHFHFLIKVKSQQAVDDFILCKSFTTGKPAVPEDLNYSQRTHYIVRRQFHNFFCGYAKAFNRYTNRKGSLLQQNTKRKLVRETSYLKTVAQYIHLNPVHHGFTEVPEEWPYSSFHTYLGNDQNFVRTDALLQLFGGRQQLVESHREHQQIMVILKSP